ncbi:unnamed protein product, partial [Vitis vinifera]|uniref:Uncharacterized protein n=1 Tax=Vitis vinifera TaxID=29760 RepID=D7TWD0_VITVI
MAERADIERHSSGIMTLRALHIRICQNQFPHVLAVIASLSYLEIHVFVFLDVSICMYVCHR